MPFSDRPEILWFSFATGPSLFLRLRCDSLLEISDSRLSRVTPQRQLFVSVRLLAGATLPRRPRRARAGTTYGD